MNNDFTPSAVLREKYRQEIIEAMVYDNNQGMYITQISLKCPGHKNNIFRIVHEMVECGEIIKTDEVRRGRGQAKSLFQLVSTVKRTYFASRREMRGRIV